MASLSEYIGEEMTIDGIRGRMVRIKDGNTVVLFDGKRNHDVSANELRTKECSLCKKEMPLTKFRRFSSGKLSKMCDSCRESNREVSTGVKVDRRKPMRDKQLPVVEQENESEKIRKALDMVLNAPIPEVEEAKIEDVLVEVADMHYKKNADYGNSFDEQLDEDGLIVSKIMLNNKIRRFNQLLKSEAKVNESQEDTLMDLIGYAAMTLLWLRNKEGASDEQ